MYAQDKALLRMPSRPAIAWWLEMVIFQQNKLKDTVPVGTLNSAGLVQQQPSVSNGLAVTSRRPLCASARPPGI